MGDRQRLPLLAVFQQDPKFVAAEARERIASAHLGHEHGAYLA
jgi:hypothetical protein